MMVEERAWAEDAEYIRASALALILTCNRGVKGLSD